MFKVFYIMTGQYEIGEFYSLDTAIRNGRSKSTQFLIYQSKVLVYSEGVEFSTKGV